MPHTLDVSKLSLMFDALLDEHWAKLTKWEQSFVSSVYDQFERNGKLSEGQLEKLEQIWLKV